MLDFKSDSPALRYPMRVGRKLGRTLYHQVGPEPSDIDPFIGIMDTPELTVAVVKAHNERRARHGSVQLR